MRQLLIPLLVIFLVSPSKSRTADDFWRPLSRPTARDLNKLCFLDSLRGWVAGDSGTILRTTNGGRSWVTQASGVNGKMVDIFMLNERLGWALDHELPHDTVTALGTKLLRTTNGGVSWQSSSFPDTFFFCLTFLDSLNGWMGGEVGYLKGTTNGGLSWFDAAIDPGTFQQFAIRRVRFFNSRIGYAVGGRMDIAGVLWRTTNGGRSWNTARVGSEPLWDIHFHDSSHALAVGGDFDFGVSVALTTDGGNVWEYLNPRVFGEARALSHRTPREGWAPLGFTGTYMSTVDTGRTWTDRYTHDSSAVYDVVFTDSLTGYMVGERGMILKFVPVPNSVRLLEPSGLPAGFRLEQNFPNPFNPSTEIGFQIADFGLVTLRIYDVLGREVVTLVDEVLPAGGFSATFDATDLASGVYFYRLSVAPSAPRDLIPTDGRDRQPGKYVETKRMILLR